MRYLYADSEPFPLSYPFLPTLDSFVRSSARALRALAVIHADDRLLAERRGATVRAIELLDGFVVAVLAAVDAARTHGDAEPVVAYADDLQTHIEKSAQVARAARERELEHQVSDLDRQKIEQRTVMREAISEFLLVGHVGALGSRYRLRFGDGRYRLWATCNAPSGIEIGYRLATERLPDWQQARRVGSFMRGLELQVGMKKAWLSRDLTREVVHVEEHVLTAAVLEPTRAEIHLRKRAESSGDSLVLFLERGQNGFGADIDRPAETGEATRFHAVPEDLPKIEELWNRIHEAVAGALDHKEAVESVTIEGQDVFEDDRVLEFVEIFIASYAPVVAEISRRSSSPRELSLKLEHSDGRREEIYLKKDQLAAHLQALEPELRERFARLDIFPKTESEASR
jgi:hypothetical protein